MKVRAELEARELPVGGRAQLLGLGLVLLRCVVAIRALFGFSRPSLKGRAELEVLQITLLYFLPLAREGAIFVARGVSRESNSFGRLAERHEPVVHASGVHAVGLVFPALRLVLRGVALRRPWSELRTGALERSARRVGLVLDLLL